MSVYELDHITDRCNLAAVSVSETISVAPAYRRAVDIGSFAILLSKGTIKRGDEESLDTNHDDMYPTFTRLLKERINSTRPPLKKATN